MAALSLNSNLAALQGSAVASDRHHRCSHLSSNVSHQAKGSITPRTIRPDWPCPPRSGRAARVYTQATRNVNDSISFFNVADSATSALKDILVRMGELATQSSNGVLSDTQRQVA